VRAVDVRAERMCGQVMLVGDILEVSKISGWKATCGTVGLGSKRTIQCDGNVARAPG
jgi:hypothetical protein